MECQGAQSRSKEDCSSEKDEFTSRCGDDEEFPQTCELSQQIQSTFSRNNEPLREICRQDAEFELNESVCVAFSRTKEEISKNMTLPYFNPKSATTLQTDASKKGLGAVILQDSRPVMLASWALTGAKKNYQNLERECLAMIWGMEKFHYFLYGKQFTLKTDQKPLVSIYKKHMVEISPRIQRLIVRSFPYQSFDVHYRRGKEMPLVDALSRVSPTPVEEDGIQLQLWQLISSHLTFL